MRYIRTKRFKKAATRLPREIQAKAAKAFMLFKENPRHPSLGVKRVQGVPGVWEGCIDLNYYKMILAEYVRHHATPDDLEILVELPMKARKCMNLD
jgi:hypothetical protein